MHSSLTLGGHTSVMAAAKGRHAQVYESQGKKKYSKEASRKGGCVELDPLSSIFSLSVSASTSAPASSTGAKVAGSRAGVTLVDDIECRRFIL